MRTPSRRSSRCAWCSGSRPSARRGRSGSSPARSPRAPRPSASARKTDGAKVADKLQHTGAAKVVVRGRSLPKDERDRAYVAFLQRNLNDHLLRLESPYLLGVDGKWGEHTERAFKRICRMLGVAPARDMRTYRIVAGALATRTDEETKRASADGVDYEKRLRELFAQQRRTLPQRPPTKPRARAEARQAATSRRATTGSRR